MSAASASWRSRASLSIPGYDANLLGYPHGDDVFRFRLIDMAGSELGIIASAAAELGAGDTVQTPDGRPAEVVEVYDDEFGQEGGVAATLVVDDGADGSEQLSDETAEAVVGLVDQLGLGSQRDEIARLAAQLRDPHERADHGNEGPQRPK